MARRTTSQAELGSRSRSHGFGTTALVYAGFAALLLVVYAPALHGGMLWDDDQYVPKPALRTWSGLFDVWFTLGTIKQYYPITYSLFWVQQKLWESSFGFHVVNVLLHALGATLCWRVLERLRVPGSLFAAALFAFHPVQVESVAWMTELKNTLSGVFYMLALLAYLRATRPEDELERALATRRRWIALTWFLAALLSKAVTATFPAAVLVVLWWRDGRIEWKRDVVPLLPFFALALALGVFSAWMEKHYVGAKGELFVLEPAQRFLLAGRALWFYAAKLVWPVELVFTYPRWELRADELVAWAYPAGVIALAATLWLARGRIGRTPIAGLLFFAGTLFPALGFVDVFPFQYSFVADHFQYLASLGVLVPIAAGLALVARRVSSIPRGVAIGAASLLVLLLAASSRAESHEYVDSKTLWRATLERNPRSWMAHQNLGVDLAKEERWDEAIAEYHAALALDPKLAMTRLNLSNALIALGRRDEGIRELERALEDQPDSIELHNNLGRALDDAGEHDRAIEHYRRAIELEPRFATAHNNLASALAAKGDVEGAVASYRRAIEAAPRYAGAHNNLGLAHARAGRFADALPCFRRAVELEPAEASYHNNLAGALEHVGALDEAIAQWRLALRLKPDLRSANENLQRVLARRASGR